MAEGRYTYQAIRWSGTSKDHFRITDTQGAGRLARCYREENARIVTKLMNRGDLVADLLETLREIAEYTDPDSPEENHRADDPEVCLDTVFGRASWAVARAEERLGVIGTDRPPLPHR